MLTQSHLHKISSLRGYKDILTINKHFLEGLKWAGAGATLSITADNDMLWISDTSY